MSARPRAAGRGDTVVATLGSGRFVTGWTLLSSLVLSVSVMAPVALARDPASGLLATVLTWVCFAAGLVVIGAVERRMLSAPRRAVFVAVSVAAWSGVRPLIDDGWAHALGADVLAPLTLPFRVATNVLVWATVFTVVAILVDTVRALRGTNALLRSALEEWAASERRADTFDARVRRDLRGAAAAVGDAADSLTPATTAADVRRLGETRLRTLSHELASTTPDLGTRDNPGTPETDPPPVANRRGIPCRLPPPGLVTALFIAMLLPYALRTASPLTIAVGFAAAALLGAASDALARTRFAFTPPRSPSAVYVASAAAAGIVLSTLSISQGATPPAAAVAGATWLALALACAVSAGAVHRLRGEQRRLSGAVAGAQRALRAGTRAAQAALDRAAELVHRDGQGACVAFALAHTEPTADDLAGLRRSLLSLASAVDGAFTAVRVASPASLSALLETWARVLDVHVDIEPAAQAALTDPDVAEDAYDLVAEGLLNAVKHSPSRAVAIILGTATTGAGRRLVVRVASPGQPPAGAALRVTSRAHALGARIRVEGDQTVLQALLPLRDTDSVVSPEHPG